MSYLIKVLILLSALAIQVSWAQTAPTAFIYKEITIGEQAIESPKVVVVYFQHKISGLAPEVKAYLQRSSAKNTGIALELFSTMHQPQK